MAPALHVILAALLQLILSYTAVSSFKVELSPKKPLFRVGDRQELTCRMSQCSEEMTFSWGSLHDKPLYAEPQKSLTESTLIFKSVNINHENIIQCTATCRGTFKQAAAKIRVYSFPKDPVISGHDSFESGKEKTLTCEVADVYPAEYMTVEWLRGGEVVHTQDGEHGSEYIQSFYTFKPRISDTGESIVCRATLSLDGMPQEERTRETTVSMDVFSFPSDPTIESSGPFLEGKETNLTCTVHEIFPGDGFHIQWLDGELELHSERGKSSDKPQNLSLTIPIKPKDGEQNKTFTCKVTLEMEGVSSQKTANTTLAVHYSPKDTTIDVRPQKKLNEGETVTISCQTHSAPEGHLTIKRVRNGEEIKLVSSNGTQTSFTISFTEVSHSGTYVCEAVNKYGDQRQTVQITVQAHPLKVSMEPNNSYIPVELNSPIMLSCKSFGCPPANITWKNVTHQPLQSWNPATTFTSQLGSWTVGLEDDRTFICEVKCGSVVKSKVTQLKVYSFPSDPTIESSGPFLEGKETNLTCTVHEIFPGDGFHIQWLDGELELHSVRGKSSDKLQNLSLTIPIKPKDGEQNKTFTCKVSLEMEGVSSQKTANTTLAVYSPPREEDGNISPKMTGDGNIYSDLLQRLNSTDFMIPVIGLGILATVVSLVDYIRRAKRKGFYKLTDGIQETV